MNQPPPSSPEYFSDFDTSSEAVPSLWRENHGNFLAAFAALIFIAGSTILACRQLRFIPPRFPDGRNIPPPPDVTAVPPEITTEPPANDLTPDLGIAPIAEPAPIAEAASIAEPALFAEPDFRTPVSNAPPLGSVAEISDAKDQVTFRARGAADAKGVVMFAVYASAETFNNIHKAVRRDRQPVRNGQAELTLRLVELPKRFAVAVYHDQNANGKLDRNAFGIPSERYGFSNDARSLTGPPSFDQAALDRPKLDSEIEIKIR